MEASGEMPNTSLIVGCLEARVGAIVAGRGSWLSGFQFALITSLDSNTNLRRVRAVTQAMDKWVECRFLGDGLVMPVDLLPKVADLDLLTGFDEVWFFQNEPSLPKPAGVSLVGPVRLDVDQTPPLLGDWMEESSCELGLGDGTGLNFVTHRKDIAAAILEAADHRH